MKTVTDVETKMRWLVVDDNEEMLMFFADLAEHLAGVNAVCFNSPHTALAAFTAAPESFQFVVTDLEMPGMSGIQLCQKLHALSPALKILLVTGNRTLTEAEARSHGFCGLIHKPFPLATMQQTLTRTGVLMPA